jgi:hypothetical protein
MENAVAPKKKRSPDLTSINMVKGTRDKLRDLKKELGFRSYDALLNHVALEIRAMGAIPPADFGMIFTKEGRPARPSSPARAGRGRRPPSERSSQCGPATPSSWTPLV